MKKFAGLLLCALCGCVQIPKDTAAVTGFEAQRYLGTWYEIARLDHTFEHGLTHVTAEYSLKPDGSLRVANRGFDPQQKKWKSVEGRAFFVAGPGLGRLKVSFFRPFYGGYNILALDQRDYAYALVCGNNRSYLWILARQPTLPKAVLDALTQQANALGFNTDALIYVRQDLPPGK
jgi:apolipoprotein D and lipocalin family protein